MNTTALSTRPWRRVLGVAIAASAIALTAACGGGSDDEASTPGEITTVSVGLLPNADVAALYLGMEQGIFEKHGLKITPEIVSSGAAIVPSVVSGQYDFGYGGVVSGMTATTKGIPLQVLTTGNQEADTAEESFIAMAVKAGSPINDWNDLSGKKIGVNVVGSLNEVMIRGALGAAGLDIFDTFKFVEVPGPDMAAALANDRVDAILAAEPFLTQQAADIKIVANPFFEAFPGGTVGTYYSTPKYIKENPELAKQFTDAMNESLEFAAANPDAVRAAIVDYAEMDPALAAEINLPKFSTDLNEDSIRKQAELMTKYGIVEGDVDVDSFLGK